MARLKIKLPGLDFDTEVGAIVRAAPWSMLFASLFAWLALIAYQFGQAPTSQLRILFSGLGLPPQVGTAMHAVHIWITTQPRDGWISWGALVVIAVAAGRHIWSQIDITRNTSVVHEEMVKLSELKEEGQRRALHLPATSSGPYASYDDQDLEAKTAEVEKRVAKYNQLQDGLLSREADVQLRAAGAWWVCAAVVGELSEWVGVALLILTALWATALIAEARISLGSEYILTTAIWLALQLAIVILALPAWIMRLLLHPLARREAPSIGPPEKANEN
jgi:hypothetical protein